MAPEVTQDAERSTIEIVEQSDAAAQAIRCGAALLDQSARGKLAVTGPDAASCLNGQLTNDVSAIEPGCGAYAAFLTNKGQLLGDVRIIRTADTFELDTERSSLQALFDVLRMALVGHDAELHKRTLQCGLLSLLGPRAQHVAQVDDLVVCELKNAPITVDGIPAHALISRKGVDILCSAEDTEQIAATLRERGATEIGEAAAEVARIERGRPRFGVELDERTMPQEAGMLEQYVSFSKGCYVGQETVARLFYRGNPNRHLLGLQFDGEPSGDPTVRQGDKVVGRAPRVARSHRLGLIALAVLRRSVEPGSTVEVGDTTATAVALPFPRSDLGKEAPCEPS